MRKLLNYNSHTSDEKTCRVFGELHTRYTHYEDIITSLSNESLNFDYFVSTDVFVYIGDLPDVFRLIKSRSKTGGKLAFSTEYYDGDGFFLEQTGRYLHSKKYIEGICEEFGYQLRYFEILPLRKEKNQYISGGLYILDF